MVCIQSCPYLQIDSLMMAGHGRGITIETVSTSHKQGSHFALAGRGRGITIEESSSNSGSQLGSPGSTGGTTTPWTSLPKDWQPEKAAQETGDHMQRETFQKVDQAIQQRKKELPTWESKTPERSSTPSDQGVAMGASAKPETGGYRCGFCEATFLHRYAFQQHGLQQHKSYWARCISCQTDYPGKKELFDHQSETGDIGICFLWEGQLDLTSLSTTTSVVDNQWQ